MGTRGNWGFKTKEEHKTTYMGYDAHPDNLGNDFILILKISKDNLREIFNKIETTDDFSDYLTPKDLLSKFSNTTDFIKMYYHKQYDMPYAIDYSYIFNLDTMKLELYEFGRFVREVYIDDLELF